MIRKDGLICQYSLDGVLLDSTSLNIIPRRVTKKVNETSAQFSPQTDSLMISARSSESEVLASMLQNSL